MIGFFLLSLFMYSHVETNNLSFTLINFILYILLKTDVSDFAWFQLADLLIVVWKSCFLTTYRSSVKISLCATFNNSVYPWNDMTFLTTFTMLGKHKT